MGAKIYNSNLTKEIIAGAKLQVQDGNIPSEIGNTVVPVMEVNPKLLKEQITISNDKATSGTLTTTPTTTKQFYLTGFIAGYVKNAACDSPTGNYTLTYTSDETGLSTSYLANLPIITTTAQEQMIISHFQRPIKLKLGTGVNLSGTFTAGVCLRTLTLYGYYINNQNA